MELKELKAHIEAALFAHAEPLPAARLAEALEIDEALAERILQTLQDECEAEERGVQLLHLESGWQYATKSASGEVVKKVMDTRRNTPLTPAALEVLAIIAYNQPVSRSFIDQVRGVDSSSTVSSLVEKELIAEAGRLDLPGRPIAFRTTDAFLRTFGISSLAELPALHNNEEPQEDESGLYGLPEAVLVVGAAPDAAVDEQTRALRGGQYIEGEGGTAALVGEGE